MYNYVHNMYMFKFLYKNIFIYKKIPYSCAVSRTITLVYRNFFSISIMDKIYVYRIKIYILLYTWYMKF